MIPILICSGYVAEKGADKQLEGFRFAALSKPFRPEALITTAMGLLAAIPAAVFYNFYSSRIRVLNSMVDDFALEFLNIVERNFT